MAGGMGGFGPGGPTAAGGFAGADLGDLLADLLGLVAFWWVAEKFTSAPRHPEGRRDADP